MNKNGSRVGGGVNNVIDYLVLGLLAVVLILAFIPTIYQSIGNMTGNGMPAYVQVVFYAIASIGLILLGLQAFGITKRGR